MYLSIQHFRIETQELDNLASHSIISYQSVGCSVIITCCPDALKLALGWCTGNCAD